MSLTIGSEIVYQDLIDATLQLIKSKCCNIDTFDSSVPTTLKNGGSWIIDGENITHNWNEGRRGNKSRTDYCYSRGIVSDANLVIVSSTTVEEQLISFLSSRGLIIKQNDIVSFKGIMNYYNQISSFLSAKLALVGNGFDSSSSLFYMSSNTSYPTATNVSTSDLNYNSVELYTQMEEVLNSSNNTRSIHIANTLLNFYSSCCCSSSSSSSCSSSSSTFIAYMDI